MSLEKENQSSPEMAAESICRPKMQSKISYSRDFLISLSKLDICKKLPSGFDESFLSELEAASHGTHERQRIPGSFSVQGFRRTEFGSSPPTRGESGTYSRGVHGRWDNRSSLRGGRDGDSQSDRDTESGRRQGNQSRRSWQNSEHDGLLGSGSFPRQSGYAAGSSASKAQSNEQSLLNRSTEPYQPPRPYKAVPHSRRETRDSLNDETFGSAENTNQDRAEDERRRRLSFELMRKEQQKSLQGKQKLNIDKPKYDDIPEVNESPEDAKQGTKLFDRSNDVDVPVTKFVSKDDDSRSLTNPARKPLVPPGFKSSISERNTSSKLSVPSHSEEVGRSEADQSLYLAKALVENGILDNQERQQSFQGKDIADQQCENTSKGPSLSKGNQVVASSTESNVSIKKVDMDNQSCRTSSVSEVPETGDGSQIMNLDSNKVPGLEVLSEFEPDTSNSILHKLFGGASAVNINDSSRFKEQHESVIDDMWSQNDVQSSKFAHWFLEDEKKSAKDSSYATQSDLLSLIVGSDKGGSQASHVKSPHHVLPDLPLQNSEHSKPETSERLDVPMKPEADPAILTCEDLEQKILSEYGQNNATCQAPVKGSFLSGEKPKARVDDQASQHLLSLLLKETDSKETDGISLDKFHVSEGANAAPRLDNLKEEKVENVSHPGKSLTLETLFGSAFMKELQSAEAPVSIQRSASGSSARIDFPGQQGLPLGVMGDGFFSKSAAGTGPSEIHESNILHSGQEQETKTHRIESWFNSAQVEADQLRHQTRVKGVDLQFPEEENLINPNPISRFMSSGNAMNGEHQSSNQPFDIVEKLAALNGFRDGHSAVAEGPSYFRGPYDVMESDILNRNRRAQQSPPQFHPPQAHGRPFVDPRPGPFNSPVNFAAQEGFIHQNSSANQQFPSNLQRPPFNNPNTRQMGFELPHRHPILQQMQTPGNLPPPHLLRDFPRGNPLPQQRNQEAGFMQDNTMRNFPHHQQQPNIGGRGPSPATAGRNHPEALQRLIEMELRANSKQSNPYAATGHNQGMFGNEQGMGFRYR